MSADEPLDLDAIRLRNATAIRSAEHGETGAYSKVYRSALDVLALIVAVRERDAEIARLRDESAWWSAPGAEIRLTAEIGRLRELLRQYGEHRAHCDTMGGTKPCVCGLDQALRQTGTEPPQPAEEDMTHVTPNVPIAPITPTIGRIVHYRLSAADAEAINRRREHTQAHLDEHRANSNGVQVHIGNHVEEGDVFPMVITRVWQPGESEGHVNGQVMLDGNDLLWVTSVKVGSGPRTFSWPERG